MALTATAVLGAVAIPIGFSTAPAGADAVVMPPFYTPPASMPKKPGVLLRQEPLNQALNLPVIFDAVSTRIMYTSIDTRGKVVPVTGAYLEPNKPWAAGGPRPLVMMTIGTMGQGDQCAPSFGLEHPIMAGKNTMANVFVSFDYDMIMMSKFLNQGMAVVFTDYIGLGVPGLVHTYVNRIDQGHAALDAVRAARQLPGTSLTANSPVAAYGYSQGGGASAAAGELQPTYAPDVPLKGIVAGAPPADLAVVLKGIEGNAISGVAGYTVNGIVQAYPETGPLLNQLASPAGMASLQAISNECIGDSIGAYGFITTNTLTKDGTSLGQIMQKYPLMQKIVDDQKLGRVAPAAPVLLTTDLADGTVPHPQARQLALDYCALGVPVQYDPLGKPPKAGDTDTYVYHHASGIFEGATDAVNFLVARVSDKPVINFCSQLPNMP